MSDEFWGNPIMQIAVSKINQCFEILFAHARNIALE
jgi:hypothetical protein